MFHKHPTMKGFLGGIAVMATIGVVGAPLASATSSDRLACQQDPGHWISVTDDQGIPMLTLVGATACTDAVTGQPCASASGSTQRSPYPGWVQVTDDLGVPWLYQAGYAPTSSTDCVKTNVTESVAASPAAPASAAQSSRPSMKSPYAGWVVVFDDQGIPWLQPISQFR